MDPNDTQEMAAALRQAADLLADGQMDGTKRREILRALEPVRTALLGMGFDEGASRRRVVSFLRSVSLANGVVGKRTAHRLSLRTFEEDGEAAMKWLLERRLIDDQGSEGFAISEEGSAYLDQYKGEFLPPPDQRRPRPHGQRTRTSKSVETTTVAAVVPAPEAEPTTP